MKETILRLREKTDGKRDTGKKCGAVKGKERSISIIWIAREIVSATRYGMNMKKKTVRMGKECF